MNEQTESIIIFGATGAVGKAVAEIVAARGASVFLAGRDQQRLTTIASDVNAVGYCQVDATRLETVSTAFSQASEAIGTPTGVVNCIGSVLLKPAHLTTDDELLQTLQINLMSSFAILRESAKAMRSNGGSVVFCSTAAAQIGLANHEAIAAAKAGVEGMVLSAAATYGPRGLRVNSVAPGLVKSEMTRKIWENDASASASQDMHILGRLGEPRDVANAIAFLLAPQSNWITGQSLGVDGGLGRIVPRPKQRTS